MTNKSDSNNNQSSGDGEKSQPEATSVPVNVVSPGKDGRTWRGDSADFSEDTSNITKFSRDK